ncbi:MAG: carboxypeptidase-like regulatory domain-containing protein, partial [Bryobacteraceae bacterium]
MVKEQTREALGRWLLIAKCCATRLVLLLSAHGLFAALEHHGQVTFNGVPVPGATVTVMQDDKNLVAITNSMGSYAFSNLPDGRWTIKVEMSGFATVKGDTSNSIWELKMLPLGEIHAEVLHKNLRPALAPTPAATPTAIPAAAASNTNLTEEPPQTLTGTFAKLSPKDFNQRAADGVIINGTVNNGAASRVADGNGAGVLAQSLYYGEIGILPGISSLDARSFSLTGQDTPKPAYNRFTGWFNLGGPVIPRKDNATFFIGYQRIRNRSANMAVGRMPTAAERSGDFSQSVNSHAQPVQIIDPLVGLPISGNVIPQSRISPQARSLLTFFPISNFNGSAPYNYQIPIIDVMHQDALQTRLNESVNTRNQILGNFAIQSTRSDTPSLFTFLDTTRTVDINAAINWTTHPSRRLSATFRYQFSRLSTRTMPYFANRLNVSGIAGINGNNQEAVNWGPPSLVFSRGTSGLFDAQYS